MDFKEFFEQNKKACIGGLAGAVVILMGIAPARRRSLVRLAGKAEMRVGLG